MAKLCRFFHTVKYLRPVQVYGRIWFYFFRPKPNLAPPPQRRTEIKCWKKGISKQPALLYPWKFNFLNKPYKCIFPDDWNCNQFGKLWLYHLHYFNDLTCKSDEERQGWNLNLIRLWISDNSPGVGNGWEPYPLSLRIVNWIKWNLLGNELTVGARHSLAVQTRFLRQRLEIHLLGNHLWANAKALIFSGLFFEGEEAARWLQKGKEILNREIVEQILDDGGHFELSPMYHTIMLEDLLDLINISKVYDQNVPVEWIVVAQKMFRWLSCTCHPDGKIVLFNDAALGGATTLSSIKKYMDSLGVNVSEVDEQELVHLESSGYIRCCKGQAVCFLDVGLIGPDYLPAHAHADTLNFELSVAAKRFIVDSGTSCYGVCPERLQQRSTPFHNTVTINGQDSSEVWGGFRVARRARPINLSVSETENVITVNCGHDGYKRLPGAPVHYREWKFKKGSLQIKDFIKGQFENAISRFHFHPDVQVYINDNGNAGYAVLAGETIINWSLNNGKASLVSSTYHPDFGVSLENLCLEVEFKNADSRIKFLWEEPAIEK